MTLKKLFLDFSNPRGALQTSIIFHFCLLLRKIPVLFIRYVHSEWKVVRISVFNVMPLLFNL